MNSTTLALLAGLLLTSVASAHEPFDDVVINSAYKTNPAKAAEADAKFAHAMEILASRFTSGTVGDYNTAMTDAAVLGHEGAAEMLCTHNSDERLGTAFFRIAFLWCQVSEIYFAKSEPHRAAEARKNYDYVVGRLGKEPYDAYEYGNDMLHKMVEAAAPSPAAHTSGH